MRGGEERGQTTVAELIVSIRGRKPRCAELHRENEHPGGPLKGPIVSSLPPSLPHDSTQSQ